MHTPGLDHQGEASQRSQDATQCGTPTTQRGIGCTTQCGAEAFLARLVSEASDATQRDSNTSRRAVTLNGPFGDP